MSRNWSIQSFFWAQHLAANSSRARRLMRIAPSVANWPRRWLAKIHIEHGKGQIYYDILSLSVIKGKTKDPKAAWTWQSWIFTPTPTILLYNLADIGSYDSYGYFCLAISSPGPSVWVVSTHLLLTNHGRTSGEHSFGGSENLRWIGDSTASYFSVSLLVLVSQLNVPNLSATNLSCLWIYPCSL